MPYEPAVGAACADVDVESTMVVSFVLFHQSQVPIQVTTVGVSKSKPRPTHDPRQRSHERISH